MVGTIKTCRGCNSELPIGSFWVRPSTGKHINLCRDCDRVRKSAWRRAAPGSQVTLTRKERHPLFHIWCGMRARCQFGWHHAFKNYGGRGIRISSRWRDSLDDFCRDLMAEIGPRPGPEFTLDRIDNDGNYEPGNVRWATRAAQASNRRQAVRLFLTHRGETRSLSAWAAALGLSYKGFYKRVWAGLTHDQIFAPRKRRASN